MENTNIIIYQTEDGNTKIETRLEDETVWLTIDQMAELFQKSRSTINEHILNIYEEKELDTKQSMRKIGNSDFSTKPTNYYNLDVIISVGYRVKSHQGTKFRQWATARLREYIVKGFTMNDELLKQAGGGNYFDELLARIRDIRSSEKVFWRKVLDIYATSIDYDPKLASRRATGGTRPALDYPALLSIPIIEDKRILEITSKVVEQKKQNEAQADKLLSSIDDYLLNELGIKLPEPPENTLKNRMFTRTLSEIQNKRVDPFFHQDKFINNLTAISNGKYPVKQLRDIISGNLIKGSLPKQDEKDGEYSVVQINSINADGTIALDDLLTAKNIFSNQQKLKVGDVLVVITGATIGKIAFWNYDGDYFLGGDTVKFQTNSLSDNAFVYHFLRCSLMQTEIKRNITGATNGHLAPEDIAHLPIPIPPLNKQKEIAEHITDIRQQAQELKDKTNEALKKASEEIEKILLG